MTSVKTVRITNQDVLDALNCITGGRCLATGDDVEKAANHFVVTKSSGIPGKACTELPGLVFGEPTRPVKKIGVAMTLTESMIELAGATGIDAIVAHHPVADAANCGGVTLKNYLSLYGLSIFELHEAFHGLHPGIAFIHGHRVFRTDIAYGGIPGNILMVGRAHEAGLTLQKIRERLRLYANWGEEERLLQAERDCRSCPAIAEAVTATESRILLGAPDNAVRTVLHIFPHTGFTAEQLALAKAEHPEADTVIASISRVREENPLVEKARELGLNFLLGNSHALEILENGMPLAMALQELLPSVEIVLLRERVTATPVRQAANPAAREYAMAMAGQYLLPPDRAASLYREQTKKQEE